MKTNVLWDGFSVRLRPVKGSGRITVACEPDCVVGGVLLALRPGATLAKGGGWRPKGYPEPLPMGVSLQAVTVERGGRRELLADQPAWGDKLPDMEGSPWLLPAAMHCDRLEVTLLVDRTAASMRWWLESLLLGPVAGQRRVAAAHVVPDIPPKPIEDARRPGRAHVASWEARERLAKVRRRQAAPPVEGSPPVARTAVRPRRRVVRPVGGPGMDRVPSKRGHLRLVEDPDADRG